MSILKSHIVIIRITRTDSLYKTEEKMKLIACDLDNTLLRRDKTVSEYTLQFFARCQEAWHKIAFVTARGFSRVALSILSDRIAVFSTEAALYA